MCCVSVNIPEIVYVLLQVRTVQKYPYVLQSKVRIPVFSHHDILVFTYYEFVLVKGNYAFIVT